MALVLPVFNAKINGDVCSGVQVLSEGELFET